MERIVWFAILIFLSWMSTAAASQPTLPKTPYVLSQTVREWQRIEKSSVIFIDVRDRKEFDAGHIDGAVNIPFQEIETQAVELQRQGVEYVIYCTYSAWRAPYAANALADFGFRNVFVLEGGISAWNAGGQVIYATRSEILARIIPYDPDIDRTLKHPRDQEYKEPITLTREELSKFDGKDGRPAYVAVDGVIYDLTQSRLWRGGEHDPSYGRVKAGDDLSEAIKESPHGKANLERFPVVGKLAD